MREQAATILAVCGDGLADFDRYGPRLFGSLEDLLNGPWGDPAFIRCMVIPAAMKRTEQACEPDKRLKDFYLIDRNIAERCAQRSQRQRNARQSSSKGETSRLTKGVTFEKPAATPQQRRLVRMNTCRLAIDVIESRQRPEWVLDADERALARTDSEAAFAHSLERHRAELAALELEQLAA